MDSIDKLTINTIRNLALDAVQKAGTGHPGTAMGAADTIYTLWHEYLKHNPGNPYWVNRDRFILSAGHASLLLYIMLYLTGYEHLTLEEIKNYRQFGSLTPGHPENYLTPGVEVTTGPLGQGFANAVGIAFAEAHLGAYFNRPGHEIVDHFTYVFASDGDLMEGVSAEAASLAGHQELGKLIVFYDDNRVTIEGSTDLTFSEDRAKRFRAYHWHVQEVDGYDLQAISEAIEKAQVAPQPSIIMCRTHIAFGSPNKQGSSAAHGAPLGEEEVRLTKENLGWPLEPAFHVPKQVLTHTRKAVEEGDQEEDEWQKRFESYADDYPALAEEFENAFANHLPAGWDKDLPTFARDEGEIPARTAGKQALTHLASKLPMLFGGSADLGPSVKTLLPGMDDFSPENYAGQNVHFGVREHAMGGILNGLGVYGGVIPYGGTYLVFSDYMRPSIRLAALMKLPVIYVFTHDSVLVGLDGPTHQPVEQLMSFRTMPNINVIRPCDANETVAAWRFAVHNRSEPTLLALSRQALPVVTEDQESSYRNLCRGAYILSDTEMKEPDLLLLGTGSEVHLLLEAQKILSDDGISSRVISFPSMKLFDQQPEEYQEEVLPGSVKKRLAVEAGSSLGWWKYVGRDGDVFGIDRFGIPGSTQDIIETFGFTGEEIAARSRRLVEDRGA